MHRSQRYLDFNSNVRGSDDDALIQRSRTCIYFNEKAFDGLFLSIVCMHLFVSAECNNIMSRPLAVVIMGVTGSGKTTLGKSLAAQLSWDFFDADDFHSASNIEKMRRGEPLTDEDRLPWLESLANLMLQRISSEKALVLACSALKPSYRKILLGGSDSVVFVLLEPTINTLRSRLRARCHFMPETLLDSQIETLEYDPNEVIIHFKGADAELPVADLVDITRQNLYL